jgi:hypothetical protein
MLKAFASCGMMLGALLIETSRALCDDTFDYQG